MHTKLSEQELQYLTTSPFYAPELFGIDLKEVMTKHSQRFTPVTFKKGQPILRYGQYVDRIYYIRSGFAWDTQLGKNGLEKNLLMFPQYMIGLNSIAHHQKILYDTKALIPISAYEISYATLTALVGEEPTLFHAILESSNLAIRAMGMVNIQSISCQAEQKVCQLLYCHHICENHYPALQKIYLSQQKVAGLSGIHRVSVNHIIKDLKNQHILENIDGEHKIIDLPRLKALAYDD